LIIFHNLSRDEYMSVMLTLDYARIRDSWFVIHD